MLNYLNFLQHAKLLSALDGVEPAVAIAKGSDFISAEVSAILRALI